MKYNDFCRTADNGNECPNYLEWGFGYGTLESCTLCGESEDIERYPNECPFLDKIKEYEKKHKEGGEE